MSIAMSYQKDSPMLKRYLELNGMKAVQVWRNTDQVRPKWQVALVRESGEGWPDEQLLPLRDAKDQAKKLADHCGLPLLPVFN